MSPSSRRLALPVMAPEFRPISQRHLEQYVEHRASRRVATRYELVGLRDTAPHQPSPYRDAVPHESRSHYAPRPCPDCSKDFTPLAGNQARCNPCGLLDRKRHRQQLRDARAERRAADRAAHPDRHEAAMRGLATRLVNAATRERVRMGAIAQGAS